MTIRFFTILAIELAATASLPKCPTVMTEYMVTRPMPGNRQAWAGCIPIISCQQLIYSEAKPKHEAARAFFSRSDSTYAQASSSNFEIEVASAAPAIPILGKNQWPINQRGVQKDIDHNGGGADDHAFHGVSGILQNAEINLRDTSKQIRRTTMRAVSRASGNKLGFWGENRIDSSGKEKTAEIQKRYFRNTRQRVFFQSKVSPFP